MVQELPRNAPFCKFVRYAFSSITNFLLLSPLLYVLSLEPLLHRLRDEEVNPALCGIPFISHVRMKVSAYANDITVFVSHQLDILAVKKAVERYKKVADAKINIDKSKGLWLGAWRSGVSLGPFTGVTDSSTSSGCRSSLASSRSKTGRRSRQRWIPGFEGDCP